MAAPEPLKAMLDASERLGGFNDWAEETTTLATIDPRCSVCRCTGRRIGLPVSTWSPGDRREHRNLSAEVGRPACHRRIYDLGDIAPGESATARVSPTGESELEVEFKDTDRQTQRLNAGGYFESGYRRSIRVEIKDGQIDNFDDNTKLW